MPLVNVKCTNCGANLKVDDKKDAAICESCGSAFIVEKAINNFNITNNSTIQANVQADVINIYNSVANDFEIVAGELIHYKGASQDVIIPENVTRISKSAFELCKSLNSITIPSSVEDIEDETFDSLYGTKIVLQEGTKLVLYGAFKGSPLSEFIIPDSVIEIGTRAFYGCTALKHINLPNGLEFIGEEAFAESSIEEISIPDSVTRIYEKTFSFCSSLNEISLSKNITKIDEGAFECCKIKNINLPEGLLEIGKKAFDFCEELESINIPNSVTTIGEYAFRQCVKLKTVTIPRSVKSIGECVFADCFNLSDINVDTDNPYFTVSEGVLFSRDMKKLVMYLSTKNNSQYVIPSTVTEISRGAFYKCKNLKSVVIPQSVTKIDMFAFQECFSLEKVTITNDLTEIHESAFFLCRADLCIESPNAIKQSIFSNASSTNTNRVDNRQQLILELQEKIDSEKKKATLYGVLALIMFVLLYGWMYIATSNDLDSMLGIGIFIILLFEAIFTILGLKYRFSVIKHQRELSRR